MERATQKIEEASRQRKRLQESSRANIESNSTNEKSQYILALGGVAAGLTIATIVWLANTILTKDNINMTYSELAETSQTVEIKKSIDNIAQLNARVELLTEIISNLEAKLTRVMILADDIPDHENEFVIANVKPVASAKLETGEVFTPTHTVKAKLNLRPSASLSTTPITVLKDDAKVEYIREVDGWYYVNTQSHGKGWCSPDYLSPIP